MSMKRGSTVAIVNNHMPNSVYPQYKHVADLNRQSPQPQTKKCTAPKNTTGLTRLAFSLLKSQGLAM
jgi:hypothetical protein